MNKLIIFLLFIIKTSFVQAIETPAKQGILYDYETKTVLFEKNSDELMSPSSMSKIMTIYYLFKKIKDGEISIDDEFEVSKKAWKKGGSKMFVNLKSMVRVEDLIRGIIVQSGNDACIVVAEGISGSEDIFADELNELANEIGLENSNFTNSTGMHNNDNYSTVYDIAILSQYLINEFPEYYHLFAETEFEWSGIKQKNRNPLLYKKMGVDGLKTGHLSISGYGLPASAVEGNRRVISVTNGFSTQQKRSQGSSRLITWAFREYENIELFKKSQEIDLIKVPGSNESLSSVSASSDIILTVPKTKNKSLDFSIELDSQISFPVAAGTKIGQLKVNIPNESSEYFDIYSTNELKRTNIFSRFFSYIYQSIVNLFV